MRTQRIAIRRRTKGPAQHGSAAVELLIAFALLLLFALGVVQIALVYEARALLSLAVQDAARAGSVANARTAPIESALAQAIAALHFPARDVAARAAAIELSARHFREGMQQGWIAWQRVSPVAASFVDWGAPPRNDNNEPVAGADEIGVDNLAHRIRHQRPLAGIAGFVGDEPVGAASGQTLSQATLLKLELRYGVPLSVPLAGRVFGWLMRWHHGCTQRAELRLGAIELGRQPAAPRSGLCAFYQGSDPYGRIVPRWPVQVTATSRMQSALIAGTGWR